MHGSIVELHQDWKGVLEHVHARTRARRSGSCAVFARVQLDITAPRPATEHESVAEISFKGTDEENAAISKNAASIVAGATAKDKEFEPPWKHMLGMMLDPKRTK